MATAAVPAAALDDEAVPLLAVSTKKESRARQVKLTLGGACGCMSSLRSMHVSAVPASYGRRRWP